MFSSFPDYRNFAETALRRLRNDPERNTSNRLGGMALNIVLLAGLWGLPLYARWMVLADRNPPQNLSEIESPQHLSEVVLGKWRQRDSGPTIRFTRNGELQLIGHESVVETAGYWINGDTLLVSGFTRQPGDHPLSIDPQRYQISIRGHLLIVKPAAVTITPDHAPQEEISSLHKMLPQWSGLTVQFQRVDTQ